MERRAPDPAVARAIDRVLAAEREAADAVAGAEREAEARLAAAREQRRLILETARRRATRLHERAQQRLAAEIAALESGGRELPANPDDLATLARAAAGTIAARLAADDDDTP